jgi:hypothetical protein
MLTDQEYEQLLNAEDSGAAFVQLIEMLNSKMRSVDDDDWHVQAHQYVNVVLGFLDSTDLDANLVACMDRHVRGDFSEWFVTFRNSVNYVQARLRFMPLNRGGVGYVPIAIAINQAYREEIHENLEKVRKAVAAMELEDRKRDTIFRKLRALQLEVDKSKTRIDAAMDLMLELTDTMGDAAENLKPVAGLMERFRKLWAAAQGESESALPGAHSEQKRITGPMTRDAIPAGKPRDLDDDIPF